MRISVNEVEDLPLLSKEYKGASAIVGKGWMRKMYMYLWIEDRRTGTARGTWKFACTQVNYNE